VSGARGTPGRTRPGVRSDRTERISSSDDADRTGDPNRTERKDSTRYAPPDYASINAHALAALPAILARWLPDGRRHGSEWVALNPRRDDRRPGSFSVNMMTGRWADFAAGDRGGDPISLAAYLHDLSQSDAARKLADMRGVRP
jgi:hypothetical protein